MPVKLDTNGTNPKMLSAAISEKLAVCVAMDIKHKLDYASYRQISPNLTTEQFDKILESVEILRAADIEAIFRTTLAEGVHSQATLRKSWNVSGAKFQLQRKDFPAVSDYQDTVKTR
ncbi:MAG: hypothetical protein ACLUKN_13730 [Bacilli bacterium]